MPEVREGRIYGAGIERTVASPAEYAGNGLKRSEAHPMAGWASDV